MLPDDVRARLASLAITARRAGGGDGVGQHRSRRRGAGLEFAQYRAYEFGDDPRQVDWKLYARSDRWFIRESERDSPLALWLLLDATASMRQEDAARPGWSRLDAAKAIAACAVEVALRQGDRFGLAVCGNGRVDVHPAGAGPRQRDRCLLALDAITAGGSWPGEPALQPLWERIAPDAMVLAIGDGFDDAALAFQERLALTRREVLAIRVLTCEERDFPFRGGHRFRNVEGDGEVLADAAAVRDGFLRRFGEARRAQAARLAASGIVQVEHVLDAPVDAPLRALFAPGLPR